MGNTSGMCAQTFHDDNVLSVKDYSLGIEIGKGSYGQVHLGVNRRTAQLIAAKAINKPKPGLEYADKKRSVDREILLLRSLQHPNIVSLLDLHEDDKSWYLIFELTPHGSLSNYLDKLGRLREPEAALAMLQIFSALNCLHTHFVVHRDIKTQNVLVGKNGLHDIKLADLGISKKVDPVRLTTSGFAGTLNNMAPEIGIGKYTFSADMWSCAVMLWEMLTNQMPYHIKNWGNRELRKVKVSEARIPFKNLIASPGCIDLLKSIGHPVPESRLTTIQCMQHPWIRQGGTNFDTSISKEGLVRVRDRGSVSSWLNWSESEQCSETE